MNLTDEAGQTVTFKNGKLGITLEYPAGTGKSGYSFAVASFDRKWSGNTDAAADRQWTLC